MKDTVNSLGALFERIGRFFDLFDLSFFVSGTVAASSIAVLTYAFGVHAPRLDLWLKVLATIIACYVAGLLCFAIGRWIRSGRSKIAADKNFDEHFGRVLRGHGLENESAILEYLVRNDDRGSWRLYVRLWAEVRQVPELAESLSFMNRYWVMAATYDGLTAAVVLWVPVIWALFWRAPHTLLNGAMALFASLLLGVCVVACRREAGRYVHYQVEELVAVIAAYRAIR